MTTETLSASAETLDDTKYLPAIRRMLKELAAGHQRIQELDREMRSLEAAGRRTQKEVSTLLRRVQRSI
jgi:transposase